MDYAMLDVLLVLFLIGGALSGRHRGFFREMLVFILWLPFVVTAGLTIFRDFDPQKGGLTAENQNMLLTMAVIFALGLGVVWVIDNRVFKPWVKGSRNQTMNQLNAALGAFMGLVRVGLTMIALAVVYDIYVKDLPADMVKQSTVIGTVHSISTDLKDYLVKNGYVTQQRVLYNQDMQRQLDLEETLKSLPASQRDMVQKHMKQLLK